MSSTSVLPSSQASSLANPADASPVVNRVTQEPWPRALWQELRTDHAGETGAVMIYHGMLPVWRALVGKGSAAAVGVCRHV